MNITLNAKDLIKLRQFREQGIESLWCETQQNDVQNLIDLMESVAEAALQASLSPMGYDMLKRAKKEFVDTLLDQSEHYRCINPAY